MSHYDNHVLMTLKLDRWHPDYTPPGLVVCPILPRWIRRRIARIRTQATPASPASPSDTRPAHLICAMPDGTG